MTFDYHPFSPFCLTVDGGRSTPKSIGQKRTPVKRSPAKTLSPLAQKLNELYNAIKNYTDQHGRELSPPFIRLPSKNVSNVNNVYSCTCGLGRFKVHFEV